jgi:hypothetical protein
MACYRNTLRRVVLAVGAAALVLGCVDAGRGLAATTDSATHAINTDLYPFATNHSSVDISSSTQCQKGDCELKVDITYPTPAAVDDTQAFPVVVLINGFQVAPSPAHPTTVWARSHVRRPSRVTCRVTCPQVSSLVRLPFKHMRDHIPDHTSDGMLV